jgi:hypothetical protein
MTLFLYTKDFKKQEKLFFVFIRVGTAIRFLYSIIFFVCMRKKLRRKRERKK